jgi:hypothetical protein
MVTDKQLLDEVRAAMHEEVSSVAAPAALLSRVHKQLRGRRARRRLVAVPVAAAVAVVVAVLPQETERAPVDLTHAAERTMTALDAVRDNVIHERAIVTTGDKYSRPGEQALYERWLAADGSTFRLRVTIDGDPVVDLSRDRVSNVFVDYRTRTYRSFPGMEPSAPQYDDVWTPEEIQQSLKNGTLTVTGAGDPVDNQPTILLHRDTRTAEVPLNLWVDATTYLPVRWQWVQDNSTPFDVTYLPPTPENRAALTTVIPPDFTKER